MFRSSKRPQLQLSHCPRAKRSTQVALCSFLAHRYLVTPLHRSGIHTILSCSTCPRRPEDSSFPSQSVVVALAHPSSLSCRLATQQSDRVRLHTLCLALPRAAGLVPCTTAVPPLIPRPHISIEICFALLARNRGQSLEITCGGSRMCSHQGSPSTSYVVVPCLRRK